MCLPIPSQLSSKCHYSYMSPRSRNTPKRNNRLLLKCQSPEESVSKDSEQSSTSASKNKHSFSISNSQSLLLEYLSRSIPSVIQTRQDGIPDVTYHFKSSYYRFGIKVYKEDAIIVAVDKLDSLSSSPSKIAKKSSKKQESDVKSTEMAFDILPAAEFPGVTADIHSFTHRDAELYTNIIKELEPIADRIVRMLHTDTESAQRDDIPVLIGIMNVETELLRRVGVVLALLIQQKLSELRLDRNGNVKINLEKNVLLFAYADATLGKKLDLELSWNQKPVVSISAPPKYTQKAYFLDLSNIMTPRQNLDTMTEILAKKIPSDVSFAWKHARYGLIYLALLAFSSMYITTTTLMQSFWSHENHLLSFITRLMYLYNGSELRLGTPLKSTKTIWKDIKKINQDLQDFYRFMIWNDGDVLTGGDGKGWIELEYGFDMVCSTPMVGDTREAS